MKHKARCKICKTLVYKSDMTDFGVCFECIKRIETEAVEAKREYERRTKLANAAEDMYEALWDARSFIGLSTPEERTVRDKIEKALAKAGNRL